MKIDHLVTVEIHFTEHDMEGFYGGVNGPLGNKPSYRLFLDGELFTERSWIYNNRTHLLEHVQFESTVTEHTIIVEPVMYPPPEEMYFSFEMRNLTVDHVLADPNIPGNKLCFTINT